MLLYLWLKRFLIVTTEIFVYRLMYNCCTARRIRYICQQKTRSAGIGGQEILRAWAMWGVYNIEIRVQMSERNDRVDLLQRGRK